MAHMVMLVVCDVSQLEAVLDAWKSIQVDHVTFMDSTCWHREGVRRPHIPMRFLFEDLGRSQEQCTLTLLAIVPDDVALQQCIATAEVVVGDFDAAESALLAAWPLPVVRGYPGRARGERSEK